MDKIKALLIDFGDTLAYVDEEEDRGYTTLLWKALSRYGYVGDFHAFKESWDKTLRESSKGLTNSYKSLWKSLLKELNMPEDLSLIRRLDGIRKTRGTNIFKLYGEVSQTLAELQKEYSLIMVSNCAYSLRRTLPLLGLDGYFCKIVLSYEVGARKPDRIVYEKALAHMDFKPSECIFIADEISDLEGAKRMGMKTLLVKQGKLTTEEAEDPNFKPDIECDHISQVPQALRINSAN